MEKQMGERGHVNLFFYSSVGKGNRQYCLLLFMLSSVLSSGQFVLATPNQPYSQL
jgi:hypothetical protein